MELVGVSQTAVGAELRVSDLELRSDVWWGVPVGRDRGRLAGVGQGRVSQSHFSLGTYYETLGRYRRLLITWSYRRVSQSYRHWLFEACVYLGSNFLQVVLSHGRHRASGMKFLYLVKIGSFGSWIWAWPSSESIGFFLHLNIVLFVNCVLLYLRWALLKIKRILFVNKNFCFLSAVLDMSISCPFSKFPEALWALDVCKCLHPCCDTTVSPLFFCWLHCTVKFSSLFDFSELGKILVILLFILKACYDLGPFTDQWSSSWRSSTCVQTWSRNI